LATESANTLTPWGNIEDEIRIEVNLAMVLTQLNYLNDTLIPTRAAFDLWQVKLFYHHNHH
jgi:hypothetical protein